MNAVVKKIKKCSIQISGVSQYTPEQQQKHGEPILLTYTVSWELKKKLYDEPGEGTIHAVAFYGHYFVKQISY